MARALADIMTELNSVYNPQRDLYNTQLAQVDPMMQADEKSLEVAKQDAFGGIATQSNRRGLLFSGIPLAEQASYVGQHFLPALANNKAKYAQKKFDLYDAIAKISQAQNRDAYDIWGQEKALDEAAAARAAAGGAGGGGWTPGQIDTPTPTDTPNRLNQGMTQVPANLQNLYNQMFLRSDGSRWSDQDLVNDYNATLVGARNGNARDRQKLELYAFAKPNLFGNQGQPRVSGLTLENQPGF